MRCRLCLQEKKLVKAHIIARCLLEPLIGDGSQMTPVALASETRPQRTQTGEYDATILCSVCDQIFAPWEEYSARLIYETARPYAEDGISQPYFVVPQYDYAQLKLCLLSILWRMSISSRPAYSHINLGGRFEGIIRDMILNRDPGTPDLLPISIVKLLDQRGQRSYMAPKQQIEMEIDTYVVGLPGHAFQVVVDDKPLPLPLGVNVLMPDRPLSISYGFLPWTPAWEQRLDSVRSRRIRE
jgi:hypothetical protein